MSSDLAREDGAVPDLLLLAGVEMWHTSNREEKHMNRRATFAGPLGLLVAMLLAQGGGDLEGAESLDLVLRGAVPDGVGAPENVVRSNVE